MDTDAPVLGDSFLRAAYVVYDQDNRNLHLAQADDCGDSLVAISTGVNAVPSVTGKCTSTAPSATKTGEFREEPRYALSSEEALATSR